MTNADRQDAAQVECSGTFTTGRETRSAVVRVVIGDGAARPAAVSLEGRDNPLQVDRLDSGVYRVTMDGCQVDVVVARGPDVDWGWVNGRVFRWPRRSETAPASPDAHDAPLAASTPATVSRVAVTAGQTVSRGDTLLVLEAMKLEIRLRAPRDGRISAVRCAEGDTVEPGVPLVDLI